MGPDGLTEDVGARACDGLRFCTNCQRAAQPLDQFRSLADPTKLTNKCLKCREKRKTSTKHQESKNKCQSWRAYEKREREKDVDAFRALKAQRMRKLRAKKKEQEEQAKRAVKQAAKKAEPSVTI